MNFEEKVKEMAEEMEALYEKGEEVWLSNLTPGRWARLVRKLLEERRTE